MENGLLGDLKEDGVYDVKMDVRNVGYGDGTGIELVQLHVQRGALNLMSATVKHRALLSDLRVVTNFLGNSASICALNHLSQMYR
jgi:hypothetical protein